MFSPDFKPSPRYPVLNVFKDGKIVDTTTNMILAQAQDHNGHSQGPIAYWRNEGRLIKLDVIQMVYEAHVKDDILNDKMKVVFKGSNEINPNNLKTAFKGAKGKNNYHKTEGEKYSTWMNGSDEVYIW